MNEKLLNHYKEASRFTYAGPYEEYFKQLPDDIAELGNLVCGQIIHRVTLREGNTNANADLRYGDMDRYPWYRMRCEDDVFLTVVSMNAILKTKGYAARCRAGYAPYIQEGVSLDHWITEYYNEKQGRWIRIGADGFWKDGELSFDQYDIPKDSFDFAGSTWLDIRAGKTVLFSIAYPFEVFLKVSFN